MHFDIPKVELQKKMGKCCFIKQLLSIIIIVEPLTLGKRGQKCRKFPQNGNQKCHNFRMPINLPSDYTNIVCFLTQYPLHYSLLSIIIILLTLNNFSNNSDRFRQIPTDSESGNERTKANTVNSEDSDC